ncbi:type I restriction enzyme HsdR N-terminal domain-containing protein [Autumnicola psychrophila]|uniref:Type I restriction enzyme HsdR N-terminal domain-containing protein n=1 Tax=Autumnicola psychrophila TaxID=3075592 RepID=A0ABU3DQC9_9FLAO|nr:type I restriction enzyme HsdR N-terminal domain-containing protein [Zunongwangia sp. F225]MDT0685916.1 type I restriction enzyme HsdR N-terminal domain-containing protein [Zunongwangia sp. F225]
MNKDKWNEFCFLLSDNVKADISENAFEQKVIQALMVLNWKQYSGDLEVRSTFQVGAANKITPDFIVRSPEGQRLFVIEIKQPAIPFNSSFQQQLFSYMRFLRLEYGVLIGQGIQIFYDGKLSNQEDPVLLETINFEKDNEKGEKFVELFSKENFGSENLVAFTKKALKKINRKEDAKELNEKILALDFKKKLRELIKQNFIGEYDAEVIDTVLEEIRFDITTVNKAFSNREHPVHNTPTRRTSRVQGNFDYKSSTLPILLNPENEYEFRRKLLLTKRAYITTYYANGKSEKKTWNAHSFRESSHVLGNIRSRPEFRQGEWQKRGIVKVFLSINE